MNFFDGMSPIFENGQHKCYFICWNEYLSENCGKWSGNRDIDLSRVEEMMEFYKKGGYIPPMIHLACLKKEPFIYSCYDGNHRRELFDRLLNEGVKIKCLVDIIFEAKQKQIYSEFENINKAVQVPAIYFDSCFETDENMDSDIYKIKEDIIKLVKKFEKKYPSFVSKSSKNKIPQFNRDNFTDDLFEVYNYFNGEKSIEDIYRILKKLNKKYSEQKMGKPHSKFGIKVIEKCQEYKFFLFLEKRLNLEHIKLISNIYHI